MTSESINQTYNSKDKLLSNSDNNSSKIIPESSEIKPEEKKEINSSSSSNEKEKEITDILSQYLNPERLIPYNDMLKKNIRTFNLFQNNDKKLEDNLEKYFKDKSNMGNLKIEINFKFTCDYESIENEFKEFFELFGEISSLKYNMNANSLKIKYKYNFSLIYAYYYLNNLIYEKKRNNKYEEYLLLAKGDEEKNDKDDKMENNDNKINDININTNDEKINDDYFKVIKYLTENYKNDNKIKLVENKIKTNDDKNNDNSEIVESSQNIDKLEKVNNNKIKCVNINNSNNEKENKENIKCDINIINSEKKILEEATNNSKQNSESNIKNINSNTIKDDNKNKNTQNKKIINPLTSSLNQYKASYNPPIVYIPFIPKTDVNLGLGIPFLVPINSTFLANKPEKKEKNAQENKINSSAINNNEKSNSQNNDDNQIKELFDKINNQIANLENNKDTNNNKKELNDNNNNDFIDFNKEITDEKKIDLKDKNENKGSKKDNKNNKNNKKKGNRQSINSINELKSILDIQFFDDDNNNNNDSDIETQQDEKEQPKNNNIPNKDIISNNTKNNNKIEDKENINPNITKEKSSNSQNDINQKNSSSNYPNSKFCTFYIPSIIPKKNNKNIYFLKNNPINFDKNVIDFNKLTLDTKNKINFMTHSSRNYYYKYVCNYTVQIENDNLFMVTKRIIGKNGCFLKKILQESCIKYGDYSTKIRLRGKGSGYIDPNINKENDKEPLMLSVSSLNYPTYYNCCLLLDNLMNKIYDDYYNHLHLILPKELHYSIVKKQLKKNEFIVDRVNSIPLQFNSTMKKDEKKDNKNVKSNNDD